MQKYLDVMMPMYNLIQYSNNYLKTLESLWQFYSENPNDILTNFESF